MECEFSPYDMSYRILKVIRYKGFESNAAFAEYMGWTRQYLNNILAAKNVGLSVVTSLCLKFPDLSARWLILGDGIMIDVTNHLTALRSWYELKDFIHVIPPADRARIDAGEHYTLEDLKRWEVALLDFQASVSDRMQKLDKMKENGE